MKFVFFRGLVLVALAGSMASFLDDWRGTPLFCGFESGCAGVTSSPFGKVGPVPLSVLGLLFFGSLLLLSLLPGKTTVRLLGPLAVLAGLAGLTLFLIQALVLHLFCQLCLLVDACALLLGTLELAWPATPSAPPPRAWPWVLGLFLAVTGPLLFHFWQPPPTIPLWVRQTWQPGKLNVVLVTDFECAYCRQMHPLLSSLLEEHGDRVHLVIEVLPLPSHPHARPAARAFWCARAQGRAHEMAQALFATEDLTSANCLLLARKVGVNQESYARCIDSADLDQQIDQSTAWVDRTQARGLPLLWINDQFLPGLQSEKVLRAALQRAAVRSEK